ncbi:prolyl 4-hydroxylase subunit alpha-1 [Drosophila eugracilis]|uniref:prolyl 4-hydroxylase subunit alpha-1 n=1 Tax=Drosophila eugracilis TaxID=29029 RepID=UPI001BDAAC8C|nr:prolyl 4-hydroxylase subunit alpha-1 [Drosophila eugracilis]
MDFKSEMFSLKYIILIGYLSASIISIQGFSKAVPKLSYAASTVALMKLLEVEDELVANLKGFVEALNKKLHLLEQSLLTMNSEHIEMKKDYETFLGNPVNSFRLIHRLHTSWEKWHQYAFKTHKDALVYIEKAHLLRTRLPTSLDLEDACRGIDELMSFYDLKPGELAVGNLAGYLKLETALSGLDCLALGEFSIRNRKEDLAKAWFVNSLAQLTNDTHHSYSVHEALGVLLINDGNLTGASNHFQEKPRGVRENSVHTHFKGVLATNRNCSAVVQKPSRLHCRYNSSTTTFARIAPLKMEELSTDPYMVFFHDVIFDSEIDSILNSSAFTLSLVDDGQKSDIRSSKDSYIGQVAKLEERVSDMTGLSMAGSEEFSLINYGLGGHYILHHDYHDITDKNRPTHGERIATVLFYLGDVDSGGATIFPLMNITVTPKKGSAVFWYNLHNSGAMHSKTLHSACPVISGSKYVLTKWINELPNLFLVPCMKNSNLHPKNR